MLTFEELGVTPELIKAITELGFENPMPVQEEVIPLLLKESTDIVALAQTGTGKTAAFGLPIIQKIDVLDKRTQALILCPTRELCLQITNDLSDFAKYTNDLHILPVYGGTSIENQIRLLKSGVQIIVATPGRLIDLMKRKAAKLNNITRVVLDEADEMLNMGFTEDINTILAQVPENRNTLLFSATMPASIAAIAKNYMKNPKEVVIGNKNSGAENVKHVCYTVHAKDKYHALKRIADYNPNIYAIIFCRTRKETQEIADKLIHDGYNADSLHGDLSQGQRDLVMQRFRIKQLQLLVATDVAARGIDVDSLTHVINYNLPDDIEAYTHRSGRTGRAGKTGISIAIINLKEKHLLRQIERSVNKKFVMAKVPTGSEICEKQLFKLIEKMEKVEVDHTQIEQYLPLIMRKLEWIDREDLIKRFMSLEFNRFLEYYKDSVDIAEPELQKEGQFKERPFRDGQFKERPFKDRQAGGSRNERFSQQSSKGFTKLFINLGKVDGIYPNDIISMVNSNTRGKRIELGKIDIQQKNSYIDVEEKAVPGLIKSLQGIKYEDKKVSVEISTSTPRNERPFRKRTKKFES
jgi:ATP-dependent RNA helicase DeaD